VAIAAGLIEINQPAGRDDTLSRDRWISVFVEDATMKKALTGFAHDIDVFCSRMNSGLGAFAIVLGVLVAALGLARAQRDLPTMMDRAISSYQLTVGE
jgi:hypothetical protein